MTLQSQYDMLRGQVEGANSDAAYLYTDKRNDFKARDLPGLMRKVRE